MGRAFIGDAMNDLQDELLRGLSADIEAGKITVFQSDADVISRLSAKFPVRTSGIVWEQVPEHRFKPSPRPKPLMDDYLPSIKEFLSRFAEDAHITSGDVVHLVGDNVTNVAFSMPFGVLLKHASQLDDAARHACDKT